jgi:ABC-type dipeptide/oligopeptide/nickel transport system permease subunit
MLGSTHESVSVKPLGTAVILEASLRFLGLGVPRPMP